MKKYFKSFYFPAMLGAGIEYYDVALYGYMAPVLVPLFLPHLEKTTAYFFYFLFEFFAALCQLLGARFYGTIGYTHGRKHAMYQSMLGTSCATFLICMLPTYEAWGLMATFLFAAIRAIQSFFLGGEYNGGAIYCLEHESNHKKYGLISGLYCAFTVSGIVMASTVATTVNALGSEYFRLAYAVSFLLALCTYKIRINMQETPEYLAMKSGQSIHIPSGNKHKFISLALASLFFGMLYGLPTRVFNALLPIAVQINSGQLMIINTVFLVVYMLLLVVFGFLSDQYGVKKVMRSAVILTCVLTYPLMLLIETKVFTAIILAKGIFASLTAAFVGPFHAWAQRLFDTKTRYKNISMYYAVGKCSSTILLASSILIFDRYQNLSSLGIILILTALITMRVFYETPVKQAPEAVPCDQH